MVSLECRRFLFPFSELHVLYHFSGNLIHSYSSFFMSHFAYANSICNSLLFAYFSHFSLSLDLIVLLATLFSSYRYSFFLCSVSDLKWVVNMTKFLCSNNIKMALILCAFNKTSVIAYQKSVLFKTFIMRFLLHYFDFAMCMFVAYGFLHIVSYGRYFVCLNFYLRKYQ